MSQAAINLPLVPPTNYTVVEVDPVANGKVGFLIAPTGRSAAGKIPLNFDADFLEDDPIRFGDQFVVSITRVPGGR
jgi:hypothetical protein